MNGKSLIRATRVPDGLLASLESRDVALWVGDLSHDALRPEVLAAFFGLPWRLVLSETYHPELVRALEATASFSDPMTRKRGFVQIIDSDPSRIELPSRCLPIYLLNGRKTGQPSSSFESRLRRMTMLEDLRRSGVREIVVLSAAGELVPSDFKDLWSSGFRAHLTFISDATAGETVISEWLEGTEGVAAVQLLRLATSQFVEDVLTRYAQTYPEDRHILRVRDQSGSLRKIDVTEADEPERPILEQYSLIEERDLSPLTPAELSEEQFIDFFRDPEASWRPYAAGLPWLRHTEAKSDLSGYLKKLDAVGAEESVIAFIASESGAGGTTLARLLAWECARQGYPVLVAKPLPFLPDALPVANFLTRVHGQVDHQTSREIQAAHEPSDTAPDHPGREIVPRRYEAPWMIVFDDLHWQYRDSELLRFRNELEKSGRPVCVLVVTSTVLGLSFYNASSFKKLAELNHAMSRDEARHLGQHLNQFLRAYGKQRHEWQWDQFYEQHTVRYLEGTAAFWVTLSFWLQGQYDLSESIQEWMYRSFLENASDQTVQRALLEIAAMSSERLPLPEVLLPASHGRWPVSHLLEDSRKSLAALGLIRISSDGQKHWALVHDILGRFLINALFYDFAKREALGFAEATDAEHLRFLLLREISRKPTIGERAFRSIGEDFATSIFKIDPDHGHGSFAFLWREVLESLDNMPQSLRDTSRLFRHHTAVSRRRVAKLDERLYRVTDQDKLALLEKAIEDITYALTFIEYTASSESNLNLYNSLANAYFDLADAEAAAGASRQRLVELRELANDATRKAYSESPTNSFVIETYVKNVLQAARDSPEQTIEYCIQALGILFSALSSNEAAYRASRLGNLADRALELLFRQSPPQTPVAEPTQALDVLVQAWTVLAEGSDSWSGMSLSDVPKENAERALGLLGHPAGRGNMQVMRLRLDLTCLVQPFAFKQQLEFVEQLQATDYRMTPQLRLEYAILLFQNGRALEGDKIFRSLRQLWRDSEHFVQVPERLRWLRAADGRTLQTVQAITGSDYGNRAMARVREFGDALVPFRPEEHGIRDVKPGFRFSCHVSFGHNGPFLRPVTAGRERT